MAEEFIRVWQRISIEEVKKHLLNIGDSLGNCESCKELGLDYASIKACPACGQDFRYMTSKNAGGPAGGRMGVVKRLQAKRPDLIFVDYDDFKLATGRTEAHKFFKS